MKYFISEDDKRMTYLKSFFKKEELKENILDLEKGDVAVFSPAKKFLLKDIESLPNDIILFAGKIGEDHRKVLFSKNIEAHNFMNDEIFATKNAMLTAEGFLSVLIDKTEGSIFSQKILIFGAGRVSKALCSLFSKLGLDFSVLTLNKEENKDVVYFTNKIFNSMDIEYQSFDILINTIPSENLLEEKEIFFKDFCVFFELASVNSLSDKKERKFSYVLCPQLPQKFVPKMAGELMKESLKRR